MFLSKFVLVVPLLALSVGLLGMFNVTTNDSGLRIYIDCIVAEFYDYDGFICLLDSSRFLSLILSVTRVCPAIT